MALDIPLTERCRKYGYLYWSKKIDPVIEKFLSGKDRVRIVLAGYLIGERNVDYKFRRISLGAVTLSRVPAQCGAFRLSFNKDGNLRIECR